MAKPVKKDEIIKIELEDLAYGGDTVGRKDDFVIFVRGGIPGEKVMAQITQVKKSYGRAKVIKILSASPDRKESFCEYSSNCGGCQIDYIDYQRQLDLKQKMVADNLAKIGDLDNLDVKEVLGMGHPYYYRNRAQFPLQMNEEGAVIKGFYKAGSHKLVEIDDCGLQHQLINRVARESLEVINEQELIAYDEEKNSGLLKHLVIKVGVCTNQAMIIIVTNGKKFSAGAEIAKELMERIPELKGVIQNINPGQTNVVLGDKNQILAGDDYIYDYIAKIKYKISPLSFFQVNTLQAEKLYQQIEQYADLSGEERVLDAYCGIGSIGLYLASEAGGVTGIEVIKEAVEMAEENAKLNGINNYNALHGKVGDRLTELKDKFDLVVVDPPRKGCSEEVIADLIELNAAKIIYVSCNPASLARDLKRLTAGGYQLQEVQPVDMFPHTYHVETVTVLRAENSE